MTTPTKADAAMAMETLEVFGVARVNPCGGVVTGMWNINSGP